MIPQPLFDCRSLQEIQFTSGDEIPTNGLTLTQVMIQIDIYIYIYIYIYRAEKYSTKRECKERRRGPRRLQCIVKARLENSMGKRREVSTKRQ